MANAITRATPRAAAPPSALPLMISSRKIGWARSVFNVRVSFSFDIKSNPVAIARTPPNGTRELTSCMKMKRIDGRSGIMPGPVESPAACNCWLYDSRLWLYWSIPWCMPSRANIRSNARITRNFRLVRWSVNSFPATVKIRSAVMNSLCYPRRSRASPRQWSRHTTRSPR